MPNTTKCLSSAPFSLRQGYYWMVIGLFFSETHMGLSLGTVSGEHDNELEWPFETPMTVTILGTGSREGLSMTLPKSIMNQLKNIPGNGSVFRQGSIGRVFGGGWETLIPKSVLFQDYVFSDSLKVHVSLHESCVVTRVLVFTNIGLHARCNHQLISAPFSVRQRYYNMELKISFTDTHMGLFLATVPGKYDDMLVWPFARPCKAMLVRGSRVRPSIFMRDGAEMEVSGSMLRELARSQESKTAFRRGSEQSVGQDELLTKNELFSDYVVDDKLTVRIKVDMNYPSQTISHGTAAGVRGHVRQNVANHRASQQNLRARASVPTAASREAAARAQQSSLVMARDTTRIGAVGAHAPVWPATETTARVRGHTRQVNSARDSTQAAGSVSHIPTPPTVPRAQAARGHTARGMGCGSRSSRRGF
eukprot:NODE_515_length_1654_cov_47.156386_g427_i0.p1 GENE.NODE_515_length_1654_cov_47.156386_g427_i0~~NODE_515_length_1654_cov_47.156386_g427_i0.p1  ORF type:complete len:420 (+),score=30.90 NODE_515_length_1654_cov_47.156386_g427_i0:169-1428(+)